MGGQVLDYEAKSIAIRTIVEDYVELGISKEKTLQALQKKYYFSEEKAEEEYNKYADATTIAIRTVVESAIAFGASKEQALHELQRKFYLPEEKAKEEYDKYAAALVP